MVSPGRDGGSLGGATDATVSEDPEKGEILRLEQALAAAETACRQRDELLSIASHALRTPLTAILGWVNLLRASALDAAMSARAIDVIERNARRQAELIADLIDANRILSGRLRLNRGRVQLKTAVDAALDGVRASAEAKRVCLHAALDPAAAVWGDSDRLQQVASILLSNAVKFSEEDRTVDVRLERVVSFAELKVRDDGAGIPSTLLAHLFDRLPHGADGGPSEASRDRAQLGLGLSIARHLAERHGGVLCAASEGPGRGATFTLRLPLSGADGEVGSSDDVAPDPATAAPRLEGLRVLIVSDDEAARDAMKGALALRGAEVTTAGSSEQALRELIAAAPDAMVVDLEMPGEQAYEFIGRARALPAEDGGQTPAVALTAHGRAEDRLRTLRAGFQIHVTKPAPACELATVVASLATRSPHRTPAGARDLAGREPVQ